MKWNDQQRFTVACAVAGATLMGTIFAAVPALAADADTNVTVTNSISVNTNADSHTLAATEAGAAWTELEAASHPPTPPDEWQLKEPTHEEQARFLMPYVMVIADKSRDFYSRFPGDTNALAAKQREFGILTWMLDNGATNQQTRLEAAEKVMLADTNLSEDDRFDIRRTDVQRAVRSKMSESDSTMLAEFENGTRQLQKEFPKRPEVLAMLLQIAENSDPEKARGMLKEIGTNDLPDELKDASTDLQKRLDRVGNPLTLQFSAIDGRQVDLAKMQGKVPLVVFWATWSDDSVSALADVKQAYDKFHDKGLEVVAINMDEDKESLTNFVATQKLEWPEYFDGLYRQTKYAVEFGVKDLPVVWLVDKKGVLRYINAGFDMDKKIESLLAE